MSETKITELLNKIDDKLKITNLFEEIIEFIKDVKPALDNIHNEINENIEKIPTATTKISKVTEATELATTEMLNILDTVFNKVDTITKELENMTNNFNKASTLFIEVLENLKDGITNEIDLKELLPKINDVIHIISNFKNDNNQERILAELQSINNDATSIMMALQVQDITSQQLAAVKHLIDTMQIRLKSILDKVDNSEFKELLVSSESDSNVTKLHRDIAFDPDAVDSMDKNLNRQQMVDEVFSSGDSENISEENDQDNAITDEKNEPNENIDSESNTDMIDTDMIDITNDTIQVDSENSKNDEEEQSQDNNTNILNDIDGNVSQDDIDKLFGG